MSNNKNRLLTELKQMLSGSPGKLFYSESQFFTMKDSKPQGLTEIQALSMIASGADIVILDVCQKFWSWETMSFEGSEPAELPAILQGRKLQRIEVSDNATINQLFELWTN